MCDCWRETFARREMSFYAQRLEQIMKLYPRAIRFTGGEPLLLKTLPALVSSAAASGALVSVISNGRLLRGKAAALATAGCGELIMSLDGAGSLHDEIRGTLGLFERCMRGIEAVCGTMMTYGINTVIQRANADRLLELADILLSQPKLPHWWHLIPVRDNEELSPTEDQLVGIPAMIAGMREQMTARGVEFFADEAMFARSGPGACTVPFFTAYVNAHTGDVYGCNMLAYADGLIGNLDTLSPDELWACESATVLRKHCASGLHQACSRCDAGSRAINFRFRELASASLEDGRPRPTGFDERRCV